MGKKSNTRARTYNECEKKKRMYSINFTVTGEKFFLGLHYNGTNSYLFVNGTEIIKFRAKDSEIVATPLCIGNISKNWSVDNMKKTGLNGYFYGFSVDYYAIAVDKKLDTRSIIKCLGLLQEFKKVLFTGLTFLSA